MLGIAVCAVGICWVVWYFWVGKAVWVSGVVWVSGLVWMTGVWVSEVWGTYGVVKGKGLACCGLFCGKLACGGLVDCLEAVGLVL